MSLPPRASLAIYNAIRGKLRGYLPRLSSAQIDELAECIAADLGIAGFQIVERAMCPHGLWNRDECGECSTPHPIPGTLADVFTREERNRLECVHGFRTKADCPMCGNAEPPPPMPQLRCNCATCVFQF